MKTIINKTSIFFHSIITVCIFSAFGIAQNTISIEVGDGTIEVLYNSNAEIGGFQFTVEGATVTGTSGGDAAANGFTVTCNSTLCLGFSFSGAIIPTGSGTLVIISADITGEVSLTGIVVSDAAGNALDFSYDSGPEAADYVVEVSNNVFTPDHLDISAGETVEWINMGGFHNVDGSTDTYPNNPDSFYNGTASSDLWSYSFTFTIAGNYDYECNPHAPSMAGTITVGSGGCTDDMACNYDADADFDDGSCLNNDCAGVCGGSAEVDECGVCGGDGSDDLGCGCFEAGPSGCDNVCGSTLENDECGVCGGDGIADGACDCAGNVDDCAGICGGSTEVDECGICGGPGATGECGCDGIAEGTCDCDGNVLDECGECGGDGPSEGYDCYGIPELFSYNVSMQQAFYFFNTVTINDTVVAPDDWVREVHPSPVKSFLMGVDKTWSLIVLTLDSLWKMLMGDVSVKNLSGPITIAKVAGDSASGGLIVFVNFLALLSVSLGVLNLLPVPMLDGGHILFYTAELIRGKPLPESVQIAAVKVGMMLLLMLMIVAFYNDISRL